MAPESAMSLTLKHRRIADVILCSALYVRLRKNVSFERSYNPIIPMFLSLLQSSSLCCIQILKHRICH